VGGGGIMKKAKCEKRQTQTGGGIYSAKRQRKSFEIEKFLFVPKKKKYK
jgi:hypothetical protein